MKYIYLFLTIAFLSYGCENSNIDSITENEFPFSPEEIEVEENFISISINGTEEINLIGWAYPGKDGYYALASADVSVQFATCKINGIQMSGTIGGPPQFYFTFNKIGVNSGTSPRGALDLDYNGVPTIFMTLNGPRACPKIEEKLEFIETDSTIVGVYTDGFEIWNYGGPHDCETLEGVEELTIKFNLRKIKKC